MIARSTQTSFLRRLVTTRFSNAIRQDVRRRSSIASTWSAPHPSHTYDTQDMQRRSMVMVSQHKATAEEEPVTKSVQNTTTFTADSNAVQGTTDQPLIITNSCWNRIRQLAERKGLPVNQVFLRVYVDAGGCSGFSYQFELEEEGTKDKNENDNDSDSDDDEEEEDLIFYEPIDDMDNRARVVIDQTSLQYMEGSTIDYVQEMIKSSFEVRDNPQSESACGCGSSFALKNFTANPALD